MGKKPTATFDSLEAYYMWKRAVNLPRNSFYYLVDTTSRRIYVYMKEQGKENART